ncbi:Hypothetical predicted protein [Paramuricea clavata]|uniref:Uncharacterized protein n=1 Tax=Paramuricea clavata TaxID=317549 RepID=A0A7D9JGA6_PARCT|nr:Hypothetical predicted protein [Paramuricea clavata]
MLVTAAHVIQDSNANIKIMLERKYQARRKPGRVNAEQVTIVLQDPTIKFDRNRDAAVVILNNTDSKNVLNRVNRFPSPSLDQNDSDMSTAILIHYAVGNYKQVSRGEREGMEGNFMLLKSRYHIRAGPGASGAPLFNLKGEVVDILKSHESINEEIRNFVPISLGSIIRGTCDETRVNTLEEYIFECNEGKESELILSNNVKIWENHRRCRVPCLTELCVRDKLTILKKEKFQAILHATVFDCLGQGGAHKDTKKWSLQGEVESDHFPPHNAFHEAYKQNGCRNEAVKKLFESNKSGKRPGENLLPAITIPKAIHGILDTTRSVEFRLTQQNNIEPGNVDNAIALNFQNYAKKGLFKRSNYVCHDTEFGKLLDKYMKGFKDALKRHEQLGFIDANKRRKLERYIRELTKNNTKYKSIQLKKRIYIKDSSESIGGGGL